MTVTERFARRLREQVLELMVSPEGLSWDRVQALLPEDMELTGMRFEDGVPYLEIHLRPSSTLLTVHPDTEESP